MKNYYRSFLTLLLLFSAITLFAQERPATHTDSLMRAGIALHDAGKFTEALAKYEEVLKFIPNHEQYFMRKPLHLAPWVKMMML